MSPWVYPRVTRRRLWRLVLAVVVVGLLAQPADAVAKKRAPTCNRCKDLPMLEAQLNQQQFLHDQFNDYLTYKVPTRPANYSGDGGSLDYMIATVLAAFNAYLNSPAGGGGGSGAAELGTDFDNCKLVLYVKGKDGKNVIDPKTKKEKTIPFNESDYRSKNCKPIADYLLAHENQHVADCKSDHKDLSAWQNYAAYDVRAYAAGIASLRKSIAALAKECHWQGSNRNTKRMEGDMEVDVVPTPDEIKNLANAVKKKGGRK